jgi:hypothetical protein
MGNELPPDTRIAAAILVFEPKQELVNRICQVEFIVT